MNSDGSSDEENFYHFEKVPTRGNSVHTTPRKLMVRASSSSRSEMLIDTLDLVCVPAYSLLALVRYPVYNHSEEKFIYRFAQMWDGIIPRKLAIYALSLEPTIPCSRMVEIGKKNILNSKYSFKDYSKLLKGPTINVFDHLQSFSKVQLSSVIDRLEKVNVSPYCTSKVSVKNTKRGSYERVIHKVKPSKFINLDSPLFYFSQRPIILYRKGVWNLKTLTRLLIYL